jgi:hypothetical protein
MVPSIGIEPMTYRLGGGRSILLSYEGVASDYPLPPTAFTIALVNSRPSRPLLVGPVR